MSCYLTYSTVWIWRKLAMWKWTDPDNIKVIILDGNSLQEDYLIFPFEDIIQEVQVYKAYKLGTLKTKNEFNIEYIDIPSLIYGIMNKATEDTISFVSISSNPLFLSEMMKYHIGTILVGEIKKTFLGNTPDFSDCTLNRLPSILQGKKSGYAGEVYATLNRGKIGMSLLKCRTEISLDNGENKKVDLYFGGRYYAEKHQYLLNDPLSTIVLLYKNCYVKAVDDFFDSAIIFVSKSENISSLTYVPPKPKDIQRNRFNRFKSLKLEKCKKNNLILEDILICTKDFSQKSNDYIMRKEFVKGAFDVPKDITGKNIILIDDVYSSGATINEAIKTLYEHGAAKVIAITLAVNQLTESSIKYNGLTCPYCKETMALIMNKEGKLFFGCRRYKIHPDYNKTLSVEDGIREIKNLNRIEIESIVDLDDEY